MIRDLFKDESGASAVEYSLLLGLIAMIVMGAITVLGQSLSTLFSNFATYNGKHRGFLTLVLAVTEGGQSPWKPRYCCSYWRLRS